MKHEFRPVWVIPAVPSGSGIQFFHSKKIYKIDRNVDEVWAILSECNGDKSIKDIVDRMDEKFAIVDIDTIKHIIADLFELGIIVDKPDADISDAKAVAALADLWTQLVGQNKPVKSAKITAVPSPDSENDFFAASAISSQVPNSCVRLPLIERTNGGTGKTSAQALTTAVGEAYERYCCGLVHTDIFAKARGLKQKWLDPRKVSPLTRAQYAKMPHLQPFSEDKEWQWVRGRDISNGNDVLVPIDLAFCPINNVPLHRKLCYEASSSGVAAFTNSQGAINRALLELIERDAIMRNWFSRQPPSSVDPADLPDQLRQKIYFWQKRGRKIYIFDLSNYGVVTALVIFVSESEYPCFTEGAASSLISFDEAVSKSFREAESELLDALAKPKTRKIYPEDVVGPQDHATLYNYPDHLDHIKWLWSGNNIVPAPKVSTSYERLIKTLQPVAVTLSSENSPLIVVRVLCDKLIPINFGYGTEHYTHFSIRSNVNPESLILPHYFA